MGTTVLFILLFIICVVVLWFASRIVIEGVDHFSQNTKVSSFATSVLLLGIITSFTEMSVGINAIMQKSPEIFVGNLIGASFVILLFIVPLLAIFSKGIELRGHLDQKRLFFFLVLILAPSFLVLDGRVTRYDACLLILLYVLFFFLFQINQGLLHGAKLRSLTGRNVSKNILKIAVGAALIYFSGRYLVMTAEYFALLLKVPEFIVSIFLLAIGTNLPELSIAWNAVLKKHTDIAFGDYVGSAAANPLIFGVLTLVNGPFTVNVVGFNMSFLLIVAGYTLFFVFARSKSRITVFEALAMLTIYIAFVCYELSEIFMISPAV